MNYKNLKILFLIVIIKNESKNNTRNILIGISAPIIIGLIGKVAYDKLLRDDKESSNNGDFTSKKKLLQKDLNNIGNTQLKFFEINESSILIEKIPPNQVVVFTKFYDSTVKFYKSLFDISEKIQSFQCIDEFKKDKDLEKKIKELSTNSIIENWNLFNTETKNYFTGIEKVFAAINKYNDNLKSFVPELKIDVIIY